jgi:hypothetical protein
MFWNLAGTFRLTDISLSILALVHQVQWPFQNYWFMLIMYEGDKSDKNDDNMVRMANDNV